MTSASSGFRESSRQASHPSNGSTAGEDGTVNLARAIDDFETHLVAERGLSAHSVRAYRSDLAALADFLTERGATSTVQPPSTPPMPPLLPPLPPLLPSPSPPSPSTPSATGFGTPLSTGWRSRRSLAGRHPLAASRPGFAAVHSRQRMLAPASARRNPISICPGCCPHPPSTTCWCR